MKVTLKFRGREMSYTALGEEILLKFADGVSEVGMKDESCIWQVIHPSLT